MSGGFLLVCGVSLLGLSALIVSAAPAWAGNPVPAPLAGAAGPIGLLAAGVAYGGYLLVKHLRSRG